MSVDLLEVQAFKDRAKKHGYASEQAKSQAELGSSKALTYKENDWSYHDNYFGGEPYGGREVIFYKERPVWMQVYYGYVIGDTPMLKVYNFLKLALRQDIDNSVPVRGPRAFSSKEWQYMFEVEGDISRYNGVETITYRENVVYKAHISGGLVDTRGINE